MKAIVMRYVVVLLLAFAVPAQARDLPSAEALRDGLEMGYVSSTRIISPCANLPDDYPEAERDAENARANLPAGVCTYPGFAETYARLMFIQAGLLAESRTPFETTDRIQHDRNAVHHCADAACAMQVLDRVLPPYEIEWKELPALDENTPRPDFLIDATAEIPADMLAKVQPMLAGIAELCGTPDDDGAEITYRLRQLTPSGNPVVVASCFTGAAQFPVWMVELAPEGPRTLLTSEDGSNCFILPTLRDGHPDLYCSVRQSAGDHPTTIYVFSGGVYTAGLEMDIQGSLDPETSLAIRFERIGTLPPADAR